MSGIGLCNKAITAVDTSEGIKLSLALKERQKKYHYMQGTKALGDTFRATESLLNLQAVPSFSLHDWTGASIMCYFRRKNKGNKWPNTRSCLE